MDFKTFKRYSIWLGQINAAVSLIIIVFIQSKHIFYSGRTAGKLLFIAMITAALALVFGIASLPRWQGFLALAIFSYVAYRILFTPLYAVP